MRYLLLLLCLVTNLFHFRSSLEVVRCHEPAARQSQQTQLPVKDSRWTRALLLNMTGASAASRSYLDGAAWLRDADALRTKLAQLRPASASAAMEHMLGVISPASNPPSDQAVQVAAVSVFFVAGAVVGLSLDSRLWLVSGLAAGIWTAINIHSNNTSGDIMRRVGLLVAAEVMGVRERYRKLIMLYRTGQLAYAVSKAWENYDAKFMIKRKVSDLKAVAAAGMGKGRRAVQSVRSFVTRTHGISPMEQLGKDIMLAVKDIFQEDVDAVRQSLLVQKASEVMHSMRASRQQDGGGHASAGSDNSNKPLQKITAAGRDALSTVVRSVDRALTVLLDGEQPMPWSSPAAPQAAADNQMVQKIVAMAYLLVLWESAKAISRLLAVKLFANNAKQRRRTVG